MILLRIDDVGRIAGDTPEVGTDSKLEYFIDWRNKSGLYGLPVYYGITYNWLAEDIIPALPRLITKQERWALHGFSHVKNAFENTSVSHLHRAATELNTNVFIAPYNDYREAHLSAWATAGGKYFLGGYDNQHWVSNPYVVYVPASYELYGRAVELMHTLPFANAPVVYTMTLHVPWERNPEYVRALVDLIKPFLVDVSAYG